MRTKEFEDLNFTIEQIEYLQKNLSWANNVRIDEWLADLRARLIYKKTMGKM